MSSICHGSVSDTPQAEGFAQAPAAVRAAKEDKLATSLNEAAAIDAAIAGLEAIAK